MTKGKQMAAAASGPLRDFEAVKKTTAGDYASEAVHLALQGMPFVGPASSAILRIAIQAPSQKRTERFLEHVHDDLSAVESKLSCLPDELYQSAIYASALISTTHIALLTNEHEKIDALRAAMLSIALRSGDDEAFNQMRIGALRDMTSIHIKALMFFVGRSPREVEALGKNNRAITPDDFKLPIAKLFRHDLPFYIIERACRELESSGLIHVPQGHTKRLSGDNFETMMATSFGMVLNDFTTLPAELI